MNARLKERSPHAPDDTFSDLRWQIAIDGHVAELALGRVARLVRLHARRDIALGLQVEVRPHLVRHVGVEFLTAEQPADSADKLHLAIVLVLLVVIVLLPRHF